MQGQSKKRKKEKNTNFAIDFKGLKQSSLSLEEPQDKKPKKDLKINENYDCRFLHDTVPCDLFIFSSLDSDIKNESSIEEKVFKGHKVALATWCLLIRKTYFNRSYCSSEESNYKFKESNECQGIKSEMSVDFPFDIVKSFFEYVYLLPKPFSRRYATLNHLVEIYKISFYFGCYLVTKATLDYISIKIKEISDGINVISSLPADIATVFLEIQNYSIDTITTNDFTLMISKTLKSVLKLFVTNFLVYSDENMAFIDILDKEYYFTLIELIIKDWKDNLHYNNPLEQHRYIKFFLNSINAKWEMLNINFFITLIDNFQIQQYLPDDFEEFLGLFSRKMIEIDMKLENSNKIWSNLVLYGRTIKSSKTHFNTDCD